MTSGLNSSFVRGEYQLYIGNNSLTRLQIASMINLNNSSQYLFYSMKEVAYNPKIYISTQNSVSLYWNDDTSITSPITHWQESLPILLTKLIL